MRKRILKTVKEAEDYLQGKSSVDSVEMLKYLDRWIGYFQHERLVHLIVTVVFAIMCMMSILGLYISGNILFIGVIILFIITMGFYIEHYYLLENKTQYLYELYDEIYKKNVKN